MENLLNFLKNLFSKEEVKKYSLGAHLNEPDNRDIPYAAVAGINAAVVAKTKYTIPLFLERERLEQLSLGTCVPHTFEFINRVKDNVLHSRRVPYVMTRNAIGWPPEAGEGLPQREAVKVMTAVGMPKDTGIDDNTLSHKNYCSLPITDAMRKDSNLHRFGGFVFPVISVDGFKAALGNNDFIAITVPIDWNKIDKDGTIHPASNVAGFHEIAIGEWDDFTKKFRFANWWSKYWGTLGDGFISYDELEQVVRDAIVPKDIPNDLIERAKLTQYIFNENLKAGTRSAAVGQLQTRLMGYGLFTGSIDRDFGPKTLAAVKEYQKLKGLDQDGAVGPKTRALLNEDVGHMALVKSKLDLWCEAIKIMEGAKPYRNNPGNLRFIGQKYAVNDNGFCKFDTYQHGYDALRDLLIRACSGLSKLYNPNGTMYDFYNVYAPASDGNTPKHYAEFVAGRMKVSPTIQIKNLLV